MPQTHSFHVVLEDGTERDIKAGAAELRDGALYFVREDSTEVKVVYAAGAWKYYELESQDDRG